MSMFLRDLMQWAGYFGKILDKTAIVGCKPKEALYFLDINLNNPILNSSYFVWVSCNAGF